MARPEEELNELRFAERRMEGAKVLTLQPVQPLDRIFKSIRKRDGRIVPFDREKIAAAIFKAARAVGGEDRQLAEELSEAVVKFLAARKGSGIPSVEEVQDAVEKVLIETGHAKTAKAYILYRDRRTRMREAKSELMDVVQEILVETNRENANISNSPSAKMLQIASAASKRYYLTRLIPEEIASAHREGDLHIHDLDFYGKTLTCIQIPLGRLLKEGFDNGHGYIRPPKRIGSAAALACIILQSSQNDMHGGQAFPFFDRDMAAFVGNASEDEVYQAMEALVYNLNSMHSLKGSERIWVFDKQESRLSTISMEEFYTRFERGRYAALSVNYHSGRMELKEITRAIRHRNFNRILRVKLKSGQQVAVTDNHSMMTVDSQGEITVAPPESLNLALTPAQWSVTGAKHSYALDQYPVSRKYPMERLELDESLARFLGFYAAEGSADGSTIRLALFDRDLEEQVTSLLKRINPYFTTRLRYNGEGKARELVCRVGKRFAAFVRDICGSNALNKRVPTEIFFSEECVVRAFLDGYLSGDGTVTNNRIEAVSVSQELRDGIFLLLKRLGLPASLSQAIPRTQFAVAHERYKIAVGGYYATALSLSGNKGEKLADLYRVTTEQTPYDYEFLRPLIADVYGVYCRNAEQYRIKSLYIEELIADLEARILKSTEEELIMKLTTDDFWFEEIAKALSGVKTTERHHLRHLLEKRELPETCKYLPVFLPYKDWLRRFFLPEDLGMRGNGRIHNECRSPKLIMRWATLIRQKNEAMLNLLTKLKRALQICPIKVDSIEELPHETYVYDISVEGNENFLTAQGVFVHNSRAGAQVPFSSLNVGTDTSPEGRLVTRCLLLAHERGLGRGETPIFPNIIFRVKKGINFDPGDPNYDLFRLAMRVSAQRLNPTFSFMDSSFNRPYGTEVGYMGCRTRVIGNRHGPEVTEGRGNLSFTTVNLPRVALRAGGDLEAFYEGLEAVMDLAARQLYHRFRIQSRLRVKDMPFLMGQHLYLDSERLGPEDQILPVIKHGTLSIGFIGLAETLTVLAGAHHGASEDARQLGYEIVGFMRRKVDQLAEEYDLNFTLLATPAEGLSGRFVALDRKIFGVVPGVTDKEYYTNSFHVPVDFEITSYDKVAIEGPFHRLTNAGHISYVEMSAPPIHNLEAYETLLRHMAACDMGYVGINFPIDECRSCGNRGIFPEDCPSCGSSDIRRVRRITGYLSTVDRFNDAKRAELRDRRPHC
ncbi:MAG: anaerobic ribonucleoside-triphosphate reductase [Firmicutes bacterium]|nr:anaerobic ribonucleoside-triphosphate reductase [Bacillota bacterium]